MHNRNSLVSHDRPRRMAIFLDAENVAGWVKHRGVNEFFNDHKKDYVISVRKAYADWSNPCVHSHQLHLNSHGFEFVHCIHPVSGKNSADIQMSIDIIECVLTMPEIDCFVIATRDSDFSPVFRRLRTYQKDIIAVCDSKSPLAKSVMSSCLKVIDVTQSQGIQQQPSQIEAGLRLIAPQYGVSVEKNENKQEAVAKQEPSPLSVIKSIHIQTPVESEKLENVYLKAMKKHRFNVLGLWKIKAIYKEAVILRHAIYESVNELKTSISHSVSDKDPMITEQDVGKMFKFFDVMGFFETKVGKDKKECFYIKKLPISEFLIEMDKAIITILIQLKDEFKFELKPEEVKKISVSAMSIKEISDYIDVETFRLEFHASTGNNWLQGQEEKAAV